MGEDSSVWTIILWSLVGVSIVGAVVSIIHMFRGFAWERRRGEEEQRLEEQARLTRVIHTGIFAALAARRSQAQRAAASGAREPQTPATALEVPAEPLLCTYRRGDDAWREAAMCPVCLADLADGETVRVLPACMHYFHPACVGEWLRVNNTCPVCRAAPAVAPPFPGSLAV